MASYPKFVQDLKELDLKKKGRKPKVSPQKFYPSQIELQTNELLKEELDDYARKLKSAAEKGGVKGVYSVLGAPPDSFEKKTKAIAEDVNKFQIKAFADFSNLVIGERYFPSTEQKNLIIKTWTDNFVNLCKSTNEEMRKRSAGIISDGVLNGRNMKELVKELQSNCSDFSRNKAELIASTEIGKLNTAINRAQSESIGLKYYEWSAAMDGRTRDSHSLMDGKICAWGKDDVYYEWVEGKDGKRELKEFKRTDKMYHGAPGTDFRCRCVALPYDPEFEDDYVREDGPVRGVTQVVPEHERISSEGNTNETSNDEFSFIKSDPNIERFEKPKELVDYISKKLGIEIQSNWTSCEIGRLKSALKAIDDVYSVFPEAKIVHLNKKKVNAIAQAEIRFNYSSGSIKHEFNITGCTDYFKKKDSTEFHESSFHPKNNDSYSTMAHEMGHIVNYQLASMNGGNVRAYESMARDIVKKSAEKMSGKELDFNELLEIRKSISGYADMSYKYTETIAEAFGDVFRNREKASKFSKVLFNAVKKEYDANKK